MKIKLHKMFRTNNQTHYQEREYKTSLNTCSDPNYFLQNKAVTSQKICMQNSATEFLFAV